MLFMANSFVAENPFEADCLKLIRKIREARGTLAHSTALKNMHMPVEAFMKLVQTLEQRGQIITEMVATSGRPTRSYRVTEV
jgi:hypothetical protein